MTASPTLAAFAERVAYENNEAWLSSFAENVARLLPGSSGVALLAGSKRGPHESVHPLASHGDTPEVPLAAFGEAPARVKGGVLLPVYRSAKRPIALWVGSDLEVKQVHDTLRGWLAIAALGLARQRRAEEAEQQRAARDHFFSMVNHDLKSPLASIKAMADLLVRKIERGTLDPATEEGLADLVDRLNFLSRRVKELAALIDEIGDISSIERGRLLLNQRSTNLGSILLSCVEQVEKEHGRTIVVEGVEQAVPVYADRERLQQVIVALLKNAVDYSEADTPITASLAIVEKYGEVTIRDEGRGIEPARKERLFREYGSGVQAHSTGLGLGLFVAAALINAHGGAIDLESIPGSGTTVRFAIPLEEAS